MCRASRRGERAVSVGRNELPFKEVPDPAADVALAPHHPVPAEGAEEALFGLVVGPELEEVRAVLRGALLEGGEEPVGMALVPLTGHHPDIDELGDSAAKRPPESADPIT